MQHTEMEELISAYADGELTPAQREVVELHLDGCLDCQRVLAEFRLTDRHLSLLVEAVGPCAVWRPDVVGRVNQRIKRRYVWLGIGRRLAAGALGVLAVAAILVAALWLLPHAQTTAPEDKPMYRTPTAASDERPTQEPSADVIYIALRDPQERATLQISSVDLLYEPPAPGAIQNLGYRLILNDELNVQDVLIVLEKPDGGQTLLDPAEAPSISLWPDLEAGDRLRLFMQLRDGSHSPVLEFSLERDADGNWLALNPTKTDIESTLKFALPKSAYIPLQTPDEQITLHLFSAETLFELPTPNAVQNLGYRITSNRLGTFVIVKVVGGNHRVSDVRNAPSIYLPMGVQSGDQIRLYAAASNDQQTAVAEFMLVQGEAGWLALNLHEAGESASSQIALPTPVAQLSLTPVPSTARGPEVSLRLEKLSIAPEQPRLGEPFTVTAVIRNLGDSDGHVPTWFELHTDDPTEGSFPAALGPVYYLSIAAGSQTEIHWDGQDFWRPPLDWGQQPTRLIFRASVNIVNPALGIPPILQPEADRQDNSAELAIDFMPYEPLVSDACPVGDNLWLEFDLSPPSSSWINTSAAVWPGLRVLVHNEGNVEVVRVPLQAITADGFNFIAYACTIPPCGGSAEANLLIPASHLSFPITVTLNPSNDYEAVFEGERGDNQIVITDQDLPCVGPTDLWLTEEDVAFEGDDLLVTINVLGKPPVRSFDVWVFHTDASQVLATKQVKLTTCKKPETVRFEGILAGWEGGYILVSLDPNRRINELVYPQPNNDVFVPLP